MIRRASFKPTETDECIAFVDWTRLVRYQGQPLFERLVKIPNERGKAGPMIAILTRMGLRKGFPDYELLVPLPPFAGLFLEAKRVGGPVGPEQEAWRQKLVDFGYHAVICEGSDAMVAAVRGYMASAKVAEWTDRTHWPREDIQ